MSLGQLLGTLTRRWYWALAGLVVTIALGYLAVQLTPPTYQATGTVLLLPSKEQMSQGGPNPFLQLGDLDSPASIVIASLNGDEQQAAIGEASPTATYAAQSDDALRGPAIQVVASDESADGALRIMHILLDAVPRTLASLQASRNVPEASRVGSMPLVVDTVATKSTNDTVRAGVAAVVGGLLMTFVLVFAIDGLLRRREQQRATAEEGENDSDAPTQDSNIDDAPTEDSNIEQSSTKDRVSEQEQHPQGPEAPIDEPQAHAESGTNGSARSEELVASAQDEEDALARGSRWTH